MSAVVLSVRDDRQDVAVTLHDIPGCTEAVIKMSRGYVPQGVAWTDRLGTRWDLTQADEYDSEYRQARRVNESPAPDRSVKVADLDLGKFGITAAKKGTCQ